MVLHQALVAVWLIAYPVHDPWWPFVESILVRPAMPLILQIVQQHEKHHERRTDRVR